MNHTTYLLISGKLETVNNSEKFVKVSAGSGRVKDGEFQFLVRSDNKDSSGSQR